MKRPIVMLFCACLFAGALVAASPPAAGFEEVAGGYMLSLKDMQDLRNLELRLRALQGQNQVLRGQLDEANARHKTLENQCI